MIDDTPTLVLAAIAEVTARLHRQCPDMMPFTLDTYAVELYGTYDIYELHALIDALDAIRCAGKDAL